MESSPDEEIIGPEDEDAEFLIDVDDFYDLLMEQQEQM